MTERATESDLGNVFVSNYPPYSRWEPDQVPALHEVLGAAPGPEPPDLGLYLHIPFCRKRCKFCYFRVYTDKNSKEVERYLDGLAREIELYAAQPYLAGRPLHFVYFGGGTPSFISPKQLLGLVVRMKDAFSWSAVDEVAFECEPGTLTEAKVHAIKDIGVTRLSLGLENMNDEILRENGRAHTTKEIHRCMPWIRDVDFQQVNVDLIAGMLGETWDLWRDTVQQTIDLDPDSITVYQMELPYNTVYAKKILDSDDDAPLFASWQTRRDWHAYAFEEFARAGFEPSSAYTVKKKGRGARFTYRDALWRGADMMATGVSSFGHSARRPLPEHLVVGRLPGGARTGFLPHRPGSRDIFQGAPDPGDHPATEARTPRPFVLPRQVRGRTDRRVRFRVHQAGAGAPGHG